MPDRCRLKEVIADLREGFDFHIQEKLHAFTLDFDPDIPNVLIIDAFRFSHIISNLLSNAIKFTRRQGTILLTLKKREETAYSCVIETCVRDTGIGISQENLKNLFKPFEQVDGGIARKYGGTGLGLALSKNIAKLMGGEMWVESEAGKGSAFYFTIIAEKVCPIALEIVTEESPLYQNIDSAEKDCPITAETRTEESRQCRNIDNLEQDCLISVEIETDESPLCQNIDSTEKDCLLSPETGTEKSPQCQNAEEGVQEQTTSTETEDSVIRNLSGKFIMLVEDVEINREIICIMLEATNVNIVCVENGRIACDVFAECPDKYDLIFMDMQMPEMDGLEATRRIRAMSIPEAKTVPIVALTANAFKEDIDLCLTAGMNDHIAKPVDFEFIMKKINEYIR